MADGYRPPQQSAGNNYYFPQQTQPQNPRHQIIRNITPPNNFLSPYNPDTPSPARSPDSHSPARNHYGMFSQGQQGQHGRVNGGHGRNMQMMYNYQHQNPPHQQTQHHQALPDHTAHATNGLSHHSSYSSGVLTNSTPSFTPNNQQNGHSATTRGGQAQQITEHWAQQLQLYKDSKTAHTSMEQGAPNHYARIRAAENKGIPSVLPISEPTGEYDDDAKDPARMSEQGKVKRQDWKTLDVSGQGVRVISAALFNFKFLTELYVSSNRLTLIPPLVGELRHLKYLDASCNQLTELPSELGLCISLEYLLVFENQIQTLPSELGSLHNLEMLGIEGNPNFDTGMKQEIVEKGTSSLISLLRENAPVPMPPEPRVILDLVDGATSNQERFKIFSFNILSNTSCTVKLYGYTPLGALSWDYRKQKILEEIKLQDADVVCLQEIEHNTFENYFCSELARSEYKGAFYPRSRAKTMHEKDRMNVDGCATFWKSNKFILLDKQIIEFANVAINRSDMKGHSDVFNRIMPRDHIGVVTFLENRITGSRVVVVNTHIFWDPAYADVKLIQVAILMESINKAAEKYSKWPACTEKKTYGLPDIQDGTDGSARNPTPEPGPSKSYTKEHLPLVICSDLNSTVDSGVYELLSKGNIKHNHLDLQGFQYGNFTKDGIEHPFQLRSAYTNVDKTPDALPFTNYTPTFRGVIDHIWYSTNSLENTSLLGPVEAEYMRKVPGFPNYHFPSDHLSLMAEFQVKGKKEKRAQVEPNFGPSSRKDRRGD